MSAACNHAMPSATCDDCQPVPVRLDIIAWKILSTVEAETFDVQLIADGALLDVPANKDTDE